MKTKILLILTLFLVEIFSANAQNDFPTSNAIWNERISDTRNIYGLLGDTIIEDIQ